ncbi:MAG TPA: RNA polymerase sigma factor [Rhodanobacteraceae bacterium]|nr:RNA polymerase sigma factor [Rhodanobacteraceae bacterium]
MSLREAALYASYRRLHAALYNVLYRQLWQREECEDVIHDAYLRVWARRASVLEASLDALIWTTALNLARNRLRWRRLWPRQPLDDAQPDHALSPPDAHAADELRRALQKLPATARDVLLLSEFAGLSGSEIAALLRIPPGTVASRKHLAMSKLKALLGATRHA